MPEIPAPVHGEGLSKVGPLPTDDEEDVVYLAARVAWRDGDVMHALSRYRLDAGVLLDRSRLVAAVPSRFFFPEGTTDALSIGCQAGVRRIRMLWALVTTSCPCFALQTEKLC